jgi:integrase
MATLSMPNPWKHPRSGQFYFRARVPSDLKHLAGREVQVTVGDTQATVRHGEALKLSLRTGAPHVAKVRHAQVAAQVQEIWDAARKGVQELSDAQLSQLAGDLYRETVATEDDYPGTQRDIAHVVGLVADALRCFDASDEEHYNPKQGEVEILHLAGIEEFLQRRGITLSPEKLRRFTPNDAAAIFEAAERETRELYRWVPAIMALSGARVAEVCQLRGKDIRQERDIWVMEITAEAGSVKNASSVRTVPLHPYLIEQGFVAFVQRKGDGPLFVTGYRRKETATTSPTRIAVKNLAQWVRDLDLEQVGAAKHRIAPNHGWRHYFTALMDEYGVTEKEQREIVGHASEDDHGRYGYARLEVLARAVRKLPTPPQYRDVVASQQQSSSAL